MTLGPATVQDAQQTLRPYLPTTRLVPAASLSTNPGQRVYLKLETDLPTGSFKVRGALYALSRQLGRGGVGEVVASSTGNHGAAVAYAARQLGVQATVFLPEGANPIKQRNITREGGRIVEGGRDLSEAFDRASTYALEKKAYFLNDATDPDVPVGAATIAAEILDQLPSASTIVVPMGDTALIRGIARAARRLREDTPTARHSIGSGDSGASLGSSTQSQVAERPPIRIIGVQAERAPSYYLSWTKHQVVGTDSCDTIADGLATRTPVDANVAAIVDLVDDVRLVGEDQMLTAIRHLLIEEHVVSEPSGAAATAAFLQSPDKLDGDTVLLVSGANITVDVLRRALAT